MAADLSTDESTDVQHSIEQLSQAPAGGQSTDDSTDLQQRIKQLFKANQRKYRAQI